MKTLTRIAALTAISALMLTTPALAQHRGGGGSGSTRSSSGSSSTPSSSVSRSSGSSYSSGSVSRSSGSSYSAPSSSYNRGTSSSSSSSSSVSRSSGSVNRGTSSSSSSSYTAPGTSTQKPRHSGSTTTSGTGTVSRSSSAASSSSATVTPSRPTRAGTVTGNTSSAAPQHNSGVVTGGSVKPNRGPISATTQNGAEIRNGVSPARDVKQPTPGFSPSQVRDFRNNPQVRTRPADRGPIAYDHAHHFYGREPHMFGHHVSVLPPHYERHIYWGRPYYIWDGIFYRSWGGHYYVCRPPYGYFFDRALYDLELFTCRFAYYTTVYNTYRIVDNNYNTIQEQNQIIAKNNAIIAEQNEQIRANNMKASYSYELAARLGLVQSYASATTQYYYDDGIFFVLNSNGQYETIVPPAGALVEELPDDYEEIELGGDTYYRVDDTVYRIVINNSKPVFEVLGQMPAGMYNKYLKN